jgi:hypothetical protein
VTLARFAKLAASAALACTPALTQARPLLESRAMSIGSIPAATPQAKRSDQVKRRAKSAKRRPKAAPKPTTHRERDEAAEDEEEDADEAEAHDDENERPMDERPKPSWPRVERTQSVRETNAETAAVAAQQRVSPAPGTATPAPDELQDRAQTRQQRELVWARGEVGIAHVNLQTFLANNLLDAELTALEQTGPAYGVAAGLRFYFFTLGAGSRLYDFPDWQLWTVNGEVAVRSSLAQLEWYFSLGAGAAWMGNFNGSESTSPPLIDISGWDMRSTLGADYFVSDAISFGAAMSGEMLLLTRPAVAQDQLGTDGPRSLVAKIYAADGSSVGVGFTLLATFGLHFSACCGR